MRKNNQRNIKAAPTNESPLMASGIGISARRVTKRPNLSRSDQLALIEALSRPRRQPNELAALAELALETGARFRELALADWSEFTTNASGRPISWTIPDERSKYPNQQYVELSPRAAGVVSELRSRHAASGSLLFGAVGSLGLLNSLFLCVAAEAGYEGLCFHDLRRIAKSSPGPIKRISHIPKEEVYP